MRADRQTDGRTDTLITIMLRTLRYPTGAEQI